MRLRNHETDPTEQPAASGRDAGTNTNDLRERGAALLAAADDAIARALSRDSATFLAQNRQAGGQ